MKKHYLRCIFVVRKHASLQAKTSYTMQFNNMVSKTNYKFHQYKATLLFDNTASDTNYPIHHAATFPHTQLTLPPHPANLPPHAANPSPTPS